MDFSEPPAYWQAISLVVDVLASVYRDHPDYDTAWEA
jgi:hypothetical protein